MASNQDQEGHSCCEMLLTARARSCELGGDAAAGGVQAAVPQVGLCESREAQDIRD